MAVSVFREFVLHCFGGNVIKPSQKVFVHKFCILFVALPILTNFPFEQITSSLISMFLQTLLT